jgi:hypothetical protein
MRQGPEASEAQAPAYTESYEHYPEATYCELTYTADTAAHDLLSMHEGDPDKTISVRFVIGTGKTTPDAGLVFVPGERRSRSCWIGLASLRMRGGIMILKILCSRVLPE